jgi:large subunit ribosomal protein L10
LATSTAPPWGRLRSRPPARAGTTGGEALRREEKTEAIEALTARLAAADTVFATDYRGLTVKQISELRTRLRAAETEYTVVKNTLARRAAADTGREALLPYLTGPTGIAWVSGDPGVAAKVLDTFAGEHAEAFAIKGGLLEGNDLPTADVTRLAKLPPKEQLLAQLAGGIAAPISGLAGGLSNLIGGLARTLAAVQAQKDAA